MDDDKLGTLAGIIKDLDELHSHDGLGNCEMCDPQGTYGVDWPCPTMKIVQRHKTASRFLIDPGPWADGYFRVWLRNTDWVPGKPEISNEVFKAKTKAECEAWIEERVNSQTPNS